MIGFQDLTLDHLGKTVTLHNNKVHSNPVTGALTHLWVGWDSYRKKQYVAEARIDEDIEVFFDDEIEVIE